MHNHPATTTTFDVDIAHRELLSSVRIVNSVQ